MAKSIMQMADEILGGCLTDPSKPAALISPPSGLHKKSLFESASPMRGNEKLVDIDDEIRNSFLNLVLPENKNKRSIAKPVEAPAILSEADRKVLSEAKVIIERLLETTTVGCIGVNFAGAAPSTKQKTRFKKKYNPKGEKK